MQSALSVNTTPPITPVVPGQPGMLGAPQHPPVYAPSMPVPAMVGGPHLQQVPAPLAPQQAMHVFSVATPPGSSSNDSGVMPVHLVAQQQQQQFAPLPMAGLHTLCPPAPSASESPTLTPEGVSYATTAVHSTTSGYTTPVYQQQQPFGNVSAGVQQLPCMYMAVHSPTGGGGLVYSTTPPAGTIIYDNPAVNYVLAPQLPVVAPLTPAMSIVASNSSMSSANSSVGSGFSVRHPYRAPTTDCFETFAPRPAGENGGVTSQTKKSGTQQGSGALATNGGTAGLGDPPKHEGSEKHQVNFQTICRHHLEGKCNRRYCRFRHVPVNSPEAQAILGELAVLA